jgi:hypothetical protein
MGVGGYRGPERRAGEERRQAVVAEDMNAAAMGG